MLIFENSCHKILMSMLMVLYCLPTFADGTGPIVGAPVEPLVPGESVPLGLEDVPPALNTAINNIAGLPAYVAAAGGGSQMVIPEIAVLQSGLKMYMANRQACIADQPRASMFCREETSPQLQNTLAAVNLALVGVNSLAVNDACKSISKALMVGQLGVTLYTAACALLQKKCNMSCSSTADGIKQILQGLIAKGAVCTPGMNPVICPEALGLLEGYKKTAYAEVNREAIPADPKSIYFKEARCAHTYTLLLASAGISILSMAKSMKESKQCDKDSDGNSSGATTTANGTTASSTTTATQTLPGTTGSSDIAPTTGTTTGTTTPTVSTTTPEVNISSGIDVAAPVLQTRSREVAGVGKASAIPTNDDSSGLRDYLPDGSKAATAANGDSSARKEITGPHGPSNFEKMRTRMQEIGLPRD